MRRFRSIIFFAIKGFGIISLLSSASIYVVSRFTISTIEVSGVNGAVEIDEKKISTNLLFFPDKKVRLHLLQEYSQFSDIQIRKKYPSTVHFLFVLKKPIAVLSTKGRMIGIDPLGYAINENVTDALPVLEFPVDRVPLGEKLTSPQILASLAFLTKMVQDPVYRITYINSEEAEVELTNVTAYINIKKDGHETGLSLQHTCKYRYRNIKDHYTYCIYNRRVRCKYCWCVYGKQ